MNIADRVILKLSGECSGLSLNLLPDDSIKVRILVMSKSGKKLRVTRKKSFDSLEEAAGFISGNSVVILSVDGYGIIHKEVDKDMNEGTISKLLPDAKISDLIIQRILPERNSKAFLSIARKEKLNEILSDLNSLGIMPFKIILGPYSLLNLLPLVSDAAEIVVPGYKIRESDTREIIFIRDDNSNGRDIEFGETEVPSEFVIPLASCLDFFCPDVSIWSNISITESLKHEFLAKKSFKIYGLVILIFFFFLLTANLLFYSRYNAENRRLNYTVCQNKKIVSETDSLKKALNEKKALTSLYNDKDSRHFSFYADRIASVIPSYVTLTRLNIYPVVKSAGHTTLNTFDKGTILLNGQLSGTGDLDMMIKRISALSWVEKVEINKYSDSGDEPATFELAIKTK